MANNFLSESYSFLYYFFINGFIAAVVFMFATLLAKIFNPGGNDYVAKNTNFCSSSECVRCSQKVEHSTEMSVISRKLEKFEYLRGTRTGLERLYKGIEYKRTQWEKDALISRQKPTVFYVHGLTCKPWYDEVYSDQLELIFSSDNYALVRSEFQKIRVNVNDGWSSNSTPEGEWLLFHLYNQGKKVEENCGMCPKTTEIVESLGSFMKNCSFGNALFSVILPYTHITPHYGPTNCRIRCHVPLFVPEGCSLCVNSDERGWKVQEPLLFDDSFLHEAWHRGKDGERVVLMVDLWHPDLTAVEKEALAFTFPPALTKDKI